MQDQLTPPDTGFAVDKRLSLREWLNHDSGDVGEHIHLFPDKDAGVLWLYRAYKEPGTNGRLVTHVTPARFAFNDRLNPIRETGHVRREDGEYRIPDDRGDAIRPRHWYLTGSEADTLFAFMDLFGREPGDPMLRVEWYGDNGKGLTAGETLDEESLYLKYRTDGGKTREVLISSVYRHQSQMLAGFD